MLPRLSLFAAALLVAPLGATPAVAAAPPSSAVAVGFGGAVASVDADATRAAIEVLRDGGNAVDAAVTAAAVLGVTEPFSAGIGGGGFLVYYDARTRTVHTIDGRETAPQSMRADAFVNPQTGVPYDFQEARVSGISVGIPGTPATWQEALRRFGTISLRDALRPGARIARRGFLVDATFAGQVAGNRDAFGRFGSTSALYLPDGQPPAVGATFRNPDLARTYDLIGREGLGVLYGGEVGRDIVRTVAHPPLSPDPVGTWAFPIRPGTMSGSDLARYRVRTPAPTHSTYHGIDVYGMAPPSSGGTAVSEALNILETVPLGGLSRTQALHRYLEASALAFADRNRYVGDGTPRPVLDTLASKRFARQRACLIDPARALAIPVPVGVLGGPGTCPTANPSTMDSNEHGTTNLTVADRWGNVVEYTLTIEQIGGNAMVVPGRGFLLNNELTDFNFTPTQGSAPDPNLPAPGKRPRSSMSPTILLRDGRPFLATGSPGGSTIITTVLQVLVNRLDLGMSLPAAIAAPRASQRNTPTVPAEPAFLALPEAAALAALGHVFAPMTEIGAATGIEFLPGGAVLAAAEPTRRGGGSAAVVRPARPGG
jgi:gamma-glutamyltranspeptidase / glutathione hydrolase